MRLADLQYRLLDRIRHRDAFAAARTAGTATDLSGLAGHHTCLLVTHKRSGEPVPSPVLFGLSEGKLYLRTEARSAKIKRIANDPRVLVGPCNFRGKPLGDLVRGVARVLPATEHAEAYAVLRANYRTSDRMFESALDRLPIDLAYVELTPESAPGS